jgi:hypothetical protein
MARKTKRPTPFQAREEQWKAILHTVQDAALILGGTDRAFQRRRDARTSPHSYIAIFERGAPAARFVLREFIVLIEAAERRLANARARDGLSAPEAAKVLPCVPRRVLDEYRRAFGEPE